MQFSWSMRENPSLLILSLTTDRRVPHISLVFREMWDTTAANLQFLALQRLSVARRSPGNQTTPFTRTRYHDNGSLPACVHTFTGHV
jgi:hypothetical protein